MQKWLAMLWVLVPASVAPQLINAEEVASEDITQTRGNVAIIRQSGGGNNVIKIQQEGEDNLAEIYQEGEANEVDVTQEGTENRLNATQLGDENKLTRHQSGHTRTTINQNGKFVTYDEDGEVVMGH